jgi:hypothetical protein
MAAHRPRSPLIFLAGALACGALVGCGKSSHVASPGESIRRLAPVASEGAVSLATSNTTRLGGGDAVADAAAVTRAAFPGLTSGSRPRAVTVVDTGNWAAALAASVLASAPTHAPLLYAEHGTLPTISSETLNAIRPAGLSALGGAQVLRLGRTAPAPVGLVSRYVATGEPATTAAAIEGLLVAADGGRRPRRVIVVAANAPHPLQMPAAGLAAESGAPILFVTRSRVPLATASVLSALHRPAIYEIDPGTVGARTTAELRAYGSVTTIGGASEGAVEESIEVARFTDGSFGWGVKEPGHGLVFASASRPLDAPAAAILSASGDYGPLLLLEAPDQLPAPLASYLSDIQPAYTSAPQFQPVHGVYNHGWVIGDGGAISPVTQARIDALLEIAPRRESSAEQSVSQGE